MNSKLNEKSYIFLTKEGFTFQPDSKQFIEENIENLQVVGFSKAKKPLIAFKKLIKENEYLLETNFDENFCIRITDPNEKYYFSLKKEGKKYDNY